MRTYAVRAADASVVAVPTLDQTRKHATVRFAARTGNPLR